MATNVQLDTLGLRTSLQSRLQICRCAEAVQVGTLCWRSGRVLVLEHYFALKSSDAASEAFSNAYPEKEVLIGNTGSVVLWQIIMEQ